ncbi:MAG: hypothetical protein A2374_02100 [Candidatus Moranbacteria bacterium RIFOXYB1_FULL_44_23]|nr:MAG: hypothetical protein A2194_03800 [Candidatus Moranbacteria bacterium RIFOXYA1_FULL_44_8]OGI34416.1 MAG: hypothetical protein A2407_04215 [Candidatus Moranbacteria bacterium RIFOXYC1_FULL_44_8]OGI40802.1 MAG: hypothetical protein A2374_02100 [Candidatus Moranbacteria bacterium RIFOXYB1_FULL_44_23]OGI43420.1 MAG: hypothetical protein A2593_03395 [Candidatus Moranbacteria bacterium RIFOXYD1_FULL_44_9]HBB36966.1 hypothetical protein [Candidatus Moranbacteria bacterium]
MENVIEPSPENLLLELKKKAKEELVTDEAAFEELVDDLLAEKIEWGELDDNEDNIALREDLVQRWEEVEEYMRRKEVSNP